MMSTAELFGGVGAMILTHRTAFEIAVDDMSHALDATQAKLSKLQKLAQGDDLRKGAFTYAGALAELHKMKSMVDELNADMGKLHEISDRRRAALPAYESWLFNRPTVAATPSGRPRAAYGGFLVASKGADSYGDLGEAREAGEIMPLQMQSQEQQNAVDPEHGVVGAAWARQHQARRQP